MTKLLVKNKKIADSSNDVYNLYNFGIPAYQAKDGTKTCPLAGACAKGCYAKSGAYVWTNVSQAYQYRFEQTLKDDFVEQLSKELTPKVKTAKRQQKQLVVRIHDSGDFYSVKYVRKWLKIMENFPDVLFYAYTKMIPLFRRLQKSGQIPHNFTIIFSEGGKADHLIDSQNIRHSRVFTSVEQLVSAGYDDASKNDTVAFTSSTGKIGLVYHGFKSREWTTAK